MRSFLISSRNPTSDGARCCLPVRCCVSCCCLCILPPTMCIGTILENLRNRSFRFPRRAARRSKQEAPTIDSEVDGSLSLLRRPPSLEEERRLWSRALVAIFRECPAMRDVARTLWKFLDSHPKTVRLLSCEGRVWDVAIENMGSFSARNASYDVSELHGTALCFLPNAQPDQGPVLALASTYEVGVGVTPHGQLSLVHPCSDPVHIKGHAREVTCCSLVGGYLVTGSFDGKVRLWRGSECVQTFESYEWTEYIGTVFVGHMSKISTVCLTVDGQVASGDTGGMICIWKRDGVGLMISEDNPVTCTASVGASAARAASGLLLASNEDGLKDTGSELNDGALLAGYENGLVNLIAWSGEVKCWWKFSCGRVLGLAQDGDAGEVLVAGSYSLVRAIPGRAGGVRLALVPEHCGLPALSANFQEEQRFIIFCGSSGIALFTSDGALQALLRSPEQNVCAAVVLPRRMTVGAVEPARDPQQDCTNRSA